MMSEISAVLRSDVRVVNSHDLSLFRLDMALLVHFACLASVSLIKLEASFT